MSQHYSDPSRESDPHALPDVEVFYRRGQGRPDETEASGWYYWYCFPGCLPDSDPVGPFNSYDEALADAQESAE